MEVYFSFTEKFGLVLSFCCENSAETQFRSILLFLCHQDIVHMIQACSLACLSFSWREDGKGQGRGISWNSLDCALVIIISKYQWFIFCSCDLSVMGHQRFYLRFLSLTATRGWTCIIRSIAKACGRRRASWIVLPQQLNDFVLLLLARTNHMAAPNIKESGITTLRWTVSEQS